ncbi:hypothetical protein ACLI1A_02855 [Flavobacterium sp. RHBU_3]|uniref:hypothetical protein n=1 Tax=Flavobacterium sp. RHBU_3 TaxID=3391184 RepID=UPI00398528D3
MKPTIFIAILALFCAPYSAVAQSKVETSKKELSGGSSSSSGNTATSRKSSDEDGDDDADPENVSLFVDITLGIFRYGLIGKYSTEDHLYNNLSAYPYCTELTGNFDEVEPETKYRFRVDVKDNFLYRNSDLFANHLAVKVRPHHAFHLDADYYHIFEQQTATGNHDLALYYFNFGYDRLRMAQLNLGWTIGMSYVGSGVDRGGFSFGFNGEMFLPANISLLASTKWSWINSKPVHAYDLGVRYHIKRFFVNGGFEKQVIASQHYNFLSLGGGVYF